MDSNLVCVSMNECGMKIIDLYDECLTHIFQFLAPNDLVNVRAVCRIFKTIAERVFYLHCNPGSIEIFTYAKTNFRENYFNRNSAILNLIRKFIPVIRKENKFAIYTKSKSRYEAYLTSLIRRITVKGVISIPEQFNEFTYIKKNCAKNIISLALYGDTIFENRKMHGEIIQDQIKDLEDLQLVHVPMKNLYEDLLQYTKNLKQLHVFCRCEAIGSLSRYVQPSHQFDSAWADYTYPKLEWLLLQTPNNTFDLLPSIHRNANLRNIGCNSLTTIKSICQTEIKLKFIAMIFFKHEDYMEVERDIVNFGRRRNFEKFELSFWDASDKFPAARFTNVPNVTGLHLFLSTIFTEVVDNDVHLPLIKKLCIYIDGDGVPHEDELRKFDSCFPNVCEIQFKQMSQFPFDYSKKYIQHIFVYPPIFRNLRQITFASDSISEFSLDDFEQINRSRLNLSKIKIYLDPVLFHKFNVNIIEMGMVVIKPWIHGCCKICMHPDYT